jgi:hypothetical protein
MRLQFGVPRTTLQRHMYGDNTRAEGHESQQLLKDYEEEALKNYICHLYSLGWAPSYPIVTYIA